MRCIHFTRSFAFFAPGFDEFAILREFHNATIGIHHVSIADENVAVRRDHHIRRPVESVGTFCSDTGLAKPHEDLSIRAQFDNLLPLAVLVLRVCDPNVSIAVDGHPVRLNEHSHAETLQELARRRELKNGWVVAVKDPNVAARIDVSRYHASKLHGRGKLRPALGNTIRVVLRMHGGCASDYCRDQ